ncbi:MAG: class II aldolase/adducin family protein [Treponema sp.]|nr:class II aldolase/adducin family protein [Treponema sp.]
MSLSLLVEMSNSYGSKDEFVVAGGGNTSFKEGGVMYVKGSGTTLATITPDQFVKMDLTMLSAMLEKDYSDDDKTRESEALMDMMAAKLPGEEDKRPSVEAVLHAIFPQKFVLHTHPAIVNGLTCGKDGAEACQRVFSTSAVWIPLTKPGYVLAAECRNLFDEYKLMTGRPPKVVILQNHGLFIAAETLQEIDVLTDEVIRKLKEQIIETPDFTEVHVNLNKAYELAAELRTLYGENSHAVFCTNAQTMKFVEDKSSIRELLEPFTPDHIVYCKHRPLFIEKGGNCHNKFDYYKTTHGFSPKIVAIEKLGFVALGKTEKEAETARLIFLDAMKVAVYTRSFGGINPLPDDFVRFILNWEAEHYRQKTL